LGFKNLISYFFSGVYKNPIIIIQKIISKIQKKYNYQRFFVYSEDIYKKEKS